MDKQTPWLVLDIGNTHTVAGVYDSGGFIHRARFRTEADLTADEYRVKLTLHLADFSLSSLKRVIVSSVVPALEETLHSACRNQSLLFVDTETPRDFTLDLPFPTQLGADRLANVAGAMTLVEPPFLIIDAGTATTFCMVNRQASYVGGAIAPGLELSWKALSARAAKLFSVELHHPPSVLGNTTETQIQSGVLEGYECLIEGMTDRLLGATDPRFQGATLFATGGCMNLLRLSSRFRIEPDLTLLGLIRYGQKTQT